MADYSFDQSNYPELVFGLVGPIGTDMEAVIAELSRSLINVGYNPTEIKLSALIKNASSGQFKHTDDLETKIKAGNLICEDAKNGAAVSALAILEIIRNRTEQNQSRAVGNEKLGEDVRQPIPRRAYILSQLKRVAEVDLLRNVYGDNFVQISVVSSHANRVTRLRSRMSQDYPQESEQQCEGRARNLIAMDEKQTETYGQQLGKIFHLADFFVHGDSQLQLRQSFDHCIPAFFGSNRIGPTIDEFGSYTAAAAALRSIDLSRQVGASIFTPEGDIIALGSNEVPKSGGGNYWQGDQPSHRDAEVGLEQNSLEKKRIAASIVERLKEAGLTLIGPDKSSSELDEGEIEAVMTKAVSDSRLSEITEYGRMTHAEMSAVCDAARLGRSVSGATIYVTTFPCHNCAKHIVASGIARVVYIEPYDKSKASSSHSDSIIVGEDVAGKVRFQNFVGISPKRYRDIFQKAGSRKDGEKVREWYEGDPRPLIKRRADFHVHFERVAATLTLKNFRN